MSLELDELLEAAHTELLASAEAEAAALASTQAQVVSLQAAHTDLQKQYQSARQAAREREAELAALQGQLKAAQKAAEDQRNADGPGSSSWAAWKRSGAEASELRSKLTAAVKAAEAERGARQALESQRAELETQRGQLETQLASARAEAAVRRENASNVPKPIAALAKALGVSMPQSHSRVVPASANERGNAVPAALSSFDSGDEGYGSSDDGAMELSGAKGFGRAAARSRATVARSSKKTAKARSLPQN